MSLVHDLFKPYVWPQMRTGRCLCIWTIAVYVPPSVCIAPREPFADDEANHVSKIRLGSCEWDLDHL